MNERHATRDDARAVAELVRAYDVSQFGETDADEAEILDWWHDLDLERDVWLVEDDGRLAAYASVERKRDGGILGDVYVHPDCTGRGLGARLNDLVEERGRELAGGPATIQIPAFASDRRAVELLESRGYRQERHYIRMVADLGDEPPPAQPAAGIEIGQFDPADAKVVHDAVNEAFADEWDFTPMPHEEFVEQRMGRSDPTLWRVARENGEVAGATLLDWKRFGVGWIGSVAVRPAWRRRGIGLALLLESFREFHRRGERRVGLTVDTQNPTDATRLYERAGMRPLFQATIFEKELT